MIKLVGNNFSLDGIFDLNLLAGLDETIHVYGTKIDTPVDKFIWMTYASGQGTISFSRNTSKFCPDVALYVVSYLETLFDIQFSVDRVHFIRTRGSVKAHRDEDGRKCCINIGVKNANSATTSYSTTDRYETFTRDRVDFVCQDGSTYLLDTSRLHSVTGCEQDRFLITYGFGASYDQVLRKLR